MQPPNFRRLACAIFLGLAAPGTGLGLVSNADEGIRLYLVYSLINSGIFVTIGTNSKPVLPPWAVWLLGAILLWGIWAIIDVLNVANRFFRYELLPEVRGPYPAPLRVVAGFFTVLGLLLLALRLVSITGLHRIEISLLSYDTVFLTPLYWLGPINLIIADRLLRGRPGWRIFTIIILALSLFLPLLILTAGLPRVLESLSEIRGTEETILWTVWIAQVVFAAASLVILFLPSVRAFFRKPKTQPGVVPS